MTIKEAENLTKGTLVCIARGDLAGYTGKLQIVRQREGLKRVCVLLPWSPEMGRPAHDRLVWVRPSEIELKGGTP